MMRIRLHALRQRYHGGLVHCVGGPQGKAEIRELRTAIAGDEHVGGLDVAMNDPVVVRELEGVTDLRGQLQGLGRRELLVPDEAVEVRAIHKLHDEVETAAGHLAEVVDRHDTGMVQAREQLRLALEAGDKGLLLRLCQFRGQHLDGHGALQLDLHRLVNGPHAAATDECFHIILRQQHGNVVRRGRRPVVGIEGVRLFSGHDRNVEARKRVMMAESFLHATGKE